MVQEGMRVRFRHSARKRRQTSVVVVVDDSTVADVRFTVLEGPVTGLASGNNGAAKFPTGREHCQTRHYDAAEA